MESLVSITNTIEYLINSIQNKPQKEQLEFIENIWKQEGITPIFMLALTRELLTHKPYKVINIGNTVIVTVSYPLNSPFTTFTHKDKSIELEYKERVSICIKHIETLLKSINIVAGLIMEKNGKLCKPVS